MTVAYELGPKAYTRLIRIKITRVLRAPNKLKCRLSCTHHQSMQLLTLIFLSLASVPPPKYAPPPTPPGAAAHCARRALASLWLVLAPCLRCPHPIPTVGAPIPEVVSKWFLRDCLRWGCVFAPRGGFHNFAAPTLHAAPLLCLVFCSRPAKVWPCRTRAGGGCPGPPPCACRHLSPPKGAAHDAVGSRVTHQFNLIQFPGLAWLPSPPEPLTLALPPCDPPAHAASLRR